MPASLPPDVLLLVCEELGNKQDFGTLFNCALSSRRIVNHALSWLYRVHNQSKLLNTENADVEWSKPQYRTFQARREQQIRTLLKWALLWKSIIRSSIGKTAYPYALYIRSLDLRNLEYLLDDPLFRDCGMDDFFAGDMDLFLKTLETPMKKRTRGGRVIGVRLHIPAILEAVGESITNFVSVAATQNHATVALDDISGDLSYLALPNWISRLSRLKSMTLYDGAVLSEAVANAINNHCTSFNDLTFFRCSHDNMDHNFAAFFGTLRSNSLESFIALSAQEIGQETLLALNNHSRSLKTLKFNGLRNIAIKNLSFLQGCLALEVLEMKDDQGFINLEATENDVFLEVVTWLGRCGRLKELSLQNFISAPAILTMVCLNNNVRFRKLEVVGYSSVDNRDFHRALSHQTSLEWLRLTADPEDDIDTLVSSICQLRNLKCLDICGTSDYFTTSEIRKIALNLADLETLKFTGYDITDDVWFPISHLHNLRALEIQAITSVSVDGILNYISTLKSTNQGLNLSVLNQSAECDISEEDQSIIQETIFEKVGGKFDFMLSRDPESSTESDSD